MLKVGLTGGIGSGKTFISNIFTNIGVKVYNADNSAKVLMMSNTELINKLIQEFGKDIYINGELNKKLLSSIIFNDEEKLKKVNSIVHPFVFADFAKWISNFKNQPYVIHEAAILFESGYNKQMDKTIAVIADKLIRINRIVERDKTTKAEVLARINNQVDDGDRIKLSDYIIYNNGNELLLPQVLQIHNQLLAL